MPQKSPVLEKLFPSPKGVFQAKGERTGGQGERGSFHVVCSRTEPVAGLAVEGVGSLCSPGAPEHPLFYRNPTLFLERPRPSSRLFSTCFQQYFKPRSPAGSKFYFDIFLTPQRIIRKPLCQAAAAPRQSPRHTAHCPGKARRAPRPDRIQGWGTSSSTSHHGLTRRDQTPLLLFADAKASTTKPDRRHSDQKMLPDKGSILLIPIINILVFFICSLMVRSGHVQIENPIPPLLGRAFPT